jgi:TRAP-type mannitol/chloroaromatic compound transport system permease large subunit
MPLIGYLAVLRGGLAFAVILVGALLAATTGVVAASVMAMGLISLPMMLRQGYSPAISSGVIMASGTLAQIIPPSLVLIVLADTLAVPVGDMYLGAMYPSLLLVVICAVYRRNRDCQTAMVACSKKLTVLLIGLNYSVL